MRKIISLHYCNLLPGADKARFARHKEADFFDFPTWLTITLSKVSKGNGVDDILRYGFMIAGKRRSLRPS